MEAALVSAATGALKPVLEKLAALLADKYRRFKEVRDEIKFLTDELAAMHSFLLKMSEVEDPAVQDKAWMNEVRELSYDIEDNLDDFVARVDDDRSAKPDAFMEKIKYLLDRTKARHGIAKAIQGLKKQVLVVGKRHARYATGEAISKPSNAMVDPRALAIFKDVSKLVGIDGPKDKIIQLLTKPTQQHSRVVSIVGFGGLGKTTLANQVYKELVGQFDCHAFLSVSRNPDMMKVLRTILSQVTRKDYVNTEAGDEQQLITEISCFLLDKRYFVVVDDIWNIEAWNVIKSIEENFVTLVGVPNVTTGTQSKVRRLSVQAKDEGNRILPANLVLSHVRSLNVFGNTVKIPSMTEFRHLRVLDFGGCRQLENQHLVNIGRLFQLRYLNLRQLGVSELPEQIKHLQCLEMLDLRDTNVRELPTAIVNLRSLVHLLVDSCVTFPDGVSKMQALEMLKRVRALKQSSNFLRELGQLKNLRKIYLDLFDVPVAGVTKACCKNSTAYQSLRNLGTQNLRSLTIWNGGSFLQQPWCPTPLGLKKLMTWRSAVPQVPAWVGSLVNLQKLRLEVESLGPEDLCILGSLPAPHSGSRGNNKVVERQAQCQWRRRVPMPEEFSL